MSFDIIIGDEKRLTRKIEKAFLRLGEEIEEIQENMSIISDTIGQLIPINQQIIATLNSISVKVAALGPQGASLEDQAAAAEMVAGQQSLLTSLRQLDIQIPSPVEGAGTSGFPGTPTAGGAVGSGAGG